MVALCHASIDAEIAAEMLELEVLVTLFHVLSTLPTQISDYASLVLECCRNLCGSDFSQGELPTDFVQSMWEILLSDNEVPSTTPLAIITPLTYCITRLHPRTGRSWQRKSSPTSLHSTPQEYQRLKTNSLQL